MDRYVKSDLLVKQFGRPRTANEAIQRIFVAEQKSGKSLERDWKFYLQLNKLIAPLARQGRLVQVGEKVGPTRRVEKVWKKA